MARTSARRALARQLQPAQLLKRYHRRTRRRVPWLQTLALLGLLPLLSLISRVRVAGRENIPDGGYIAASNHPSNLDALFVALAIRRRIRFMAKSELFGGRWGGLLNRLGAFPVQRGVWDTDAFETAATVLERGRVMSIFPEGGVHTDRVPAKSGVGHIAHLAGATAAGVPRRHPLAVHPVALAEGARRHRSAAVRRGRRGPLARAVSPNGPAHPRLDPRAAPTRGARITATPWPQPRLS